MLTQLPEDILGCVCTFLGLPDAIGIPICKAWTKAAWREVDRELRKINQRRGKIPKKCIPAFTRLFGAEYPVELFRQCFIDEPHLDSEFAQWMLHTERVPSLSSAPINQWRTAKRRPTLRPLALIGSVDHKSPLVRVIKEVSGNTTLSFFDGAFEALPALIIQPRSTAFAPGELVVQLRYGNLDSVYAPVVLKLRFAVGREDPTVFKYSLHPLTFKHF